MSGNSDSWSRCRLRPFFFARSDDPDHYPLFVERQRPIIGQLDVPDEYFVVFRPLLDGGFCVPRSGATIEPECVELKIIIDGGDTGEPVATITEPRED